MGYAYPKLKENIIIKKFEDASEEEKYIIAAGSKHWVIAEELYHLINLLDGTKSLEDVCKYLGDDYGIIATPSDIQKIIDLYIKPKGLIEGTELIGNEKKSRYFWFQIKLIPDFILEKMKIITYPYHSKLSIILLLLSLPGFFVIVSHVATPVLFNRLTGYGINEWLLTLLIVIGSGYIHEFGHIGAAMHYNMPPGHIGFAFYMTMPVLYADVSNIWVLKRRERAVVDLGGIYYEFLFLTSISFCGAILSNDLLIISASLRFIGLVYNFNPFLKMDGYWLFTDLVGISNLHDTTIQFIKGLISKLFSKSVYEPQIKLKKINRRMFYLYVCVSILFFGFFIIVLGNMLYTAYALLPNAMYDFTMIFQSKSVADLLGKVFQYLKNYFIIMISGFLVIRICLQTIKNIHLPNTKRISAQS